MWSANALLEDPDAVRQVHADYVAAGAEVLTANTFRTNPRTLGRHGIGEHDAQLTARAVDLARAAARGATRPVWIAGSLAPAEDCFRPDLVPSDVELELEHARHVQNLVEAGVDFILVETMNTAREASIALGAARFAGIPAGVCCLLRDPEHLYGGHPLDAAVAEWSRYDPLFLGLNCCAPEVAHVGLKHLLRYWDGPAAVYANLGRVGEGGMWGRAEAPGDLQRFRAAARLWVRSGARMIGGCCGTTPALIAALRRDLDAAARGDTGEDA